jgi:hypothetical protein
MRAAPSFMTDRTPKLLADALSAIVESSGWVRLDIGRFFTAISKFNCYQTLVNKPIITPATG